MVTGCDGFKKLHPTFAEVLECEVPSVGAARPNFEAAMPSPDIAKRVEFVFGNLRMAQAGEVTADPSGGAQYPTAPFRAFLAQVRALTAELSDRERAAFDAQAGGWLNGARTVTEKVYPSPQGEPATAYVDSMRTQEELSTDHKSPDSVNRFLSAPLNADTIAAHYRALFLEVIL